MKTSSASPESTPIPASPDRLIEEGPSFVVGIGASAGGLEALERFFKAMPVSSGMAFVVIQHLSPDFKSLMDELLARFTTMAIHRVSDPVQMRRNTIYLLPPRKEMVMEGDTLRVQDKSDTHSLHLPINTFFRTLAREQTDKAIAIVLSGTGSDGSLGLLDVHDMGGLVLVQSGETAKFDGMPRSAVATGVADAVLAPEDMPSTLVHYASNPARHLLEAKQPPSGRESGLPAVFDRLRETYDLDFNLYKPGTISRRLDCRAAMGQTGTLEGYCDRVLKDPIELDSLYKDLLIGVTRFFRDPEAFAIIREQVIPAIVDQLAPNEDVRVWTPGCATGEEAYSLAILFLEEFSRRGMAPALKIFATDVHRDSLQIAAEGLYPASALEELPVDLRQSYFLEEGSGQYRVTAQLRKLIIYSPHNLIKDPPFTKIDLVSCRNLLIYFQPVAQTRAVGAFYFALKPKGVLFMGPSETIGELTNEFMAVDRHWKIYRKVTEHRLPLDLRTTTPMTDYRSPRTGLPGDLRLARAYDVLMARFVPTGVLVNERREALHFFGQADRYLRPIPGRVTNDIVSMARGDLRIALSSGIQSSLKKLEKISFKSVHVPIDEGQEILIDLTVEPLPDKISHSVSVLVLFQEYVPTTPVEDGGTSAVFHVEEESRERIHLLESELQHTRESLQTAVEELETSNEELQASNEELLASNEELQSTNEELHSVNEELYSVNAEHELKIRELDQVASDLRNLMQATEIGTVFTDRDHCIRLYTPAALAVFNLMPQDIGRDIRHITSRIRNDDVFVQIAKVSATGETLEGRIATPEGNTFLRRIRPYVDLNREVMGVILTFVDVTQLSVAEAAVRASEERFRLIFENAPEGIVTVDSRGTIVHANHQVHELFGYARGMMEGLSIESLMPSARRSAHTSLRSDYASRPQSRRMGSGREFPALRRDGSEFPVEVGLSPIQVGGQDLTLAFVNDVTRRKEAEARRLEVESKMIEAAKLESLGVLAGGIAHDFNNLLTAILGSASLASMEVTRIGGNPELRESIEIIRGTAKRAAGLCKQMLAYAGKGQFVVEALSLTTLVNQMIDLVRASVSKHIELGFELDAAAPAVVMDATQIRQVVMNLVINASEAIGEKHGKITVTTGVRRFDADYLRRSLIGGEASPGMYAFFAVADTGCGIPQSDIAKIFEPFFTTKFTGRGLGLSAVLGIVRGHKGMMTVTSEVGQGTTFLLMLPPTHVEASVAGSLSVGVGTWRGSGRVLVVDDEEDVCRTSSRMLRELGFEAVTARDGEEALEMFKAEPHAIRLVLLDLTMPRRDGEETFRELKRIRSDVRVVLMSGFNQAEATVRFGPSELAGFLAKPFTSETLGEVILKATK